MFTIPISLLTKRPPPYLEQLQFLNDAVPEIMNYPVLIFANNPPPLSLEVQSVNEAFLISIIPLSSIIIHSPPPSSPALHFSNYNSPVILVMLPEC